MDRAGDQSREAKHLWPVIEPRSGVVGFYRDYKEPLVALPDGGFGYEGVLLYDEWAEKVQCHICGQWKRGLGVHVWTKHRLRAASYKDLYGLNQSTALVGESTREHLIANGLRNIHLLTPEANKRGLLAARKAVSASRRTGRSTVEAQNKKGICAAQILVWLQEHPDAKRDTADQSIASAAIRTFGSWSKARHMAGLAARNVNWQEKFDKALGIASLRAFAVRYDRPPTRSDADRGLVVYAGHRYETAFGTWRNALAAAGLQTTKQGVAVLCRSMNNDKRI